MEISLSRKCLLKKQLSSILKIAEKVPYIQKLHRLTPELSRLMRFASSAASY